jgi:hypothetical protein
MSSFCEFTKAAPARLFCAASIFSLACSLSNELSRHLNESQRAMVAGKLANMRQGERTDVQPSANLQKVRQDEAAELLNVSPRSVATAKKVQEKAVPESWRI